MEFTLKLNSDHVRTVLTGLNELKHGVARQTYDIIFGQVQRQEVEDAEAKQKAATPPTPDETSPGLSD